MFICVSVSLLIRLFASEQEARNLCVDAVSSSFPPFPRLRERVKSVMRLIRQKTPKQTQHKLRCRPDQAVPPAVSCLRPLLWGQLTLQGSCGSLGTGCSKLLQNIRRHQLHFGVFKWKRQQGASAPLPAGARASPSNGRRYTVPPLCKHGHVGSGLGQWAAGSGRRWPMRKGKGRAQGVGRDRWLRVRGRREPARGCGTGGFRPGKGGGGEDGRERGAGRPGGGRAGASRRAGGWAGSGGAGWGAGGGRGGGEGDTTSRRKRCPRGGTLPPAPPAAAWMGFDCFPW